MRLLVDENIHSDLVLGFEHRGTMFSMPPRR